MRLTQLYLNSIYSAEYNASSCHGDKALIAFQKSELNSIDNFKWDDIDKNIIPWRGASFNTSNGKYKLCVYLKWWVRKDVNHLIRHLTNVYTLDGDEALDDLYQIHTIYLYKVDSPSDDVPDDYTFETHLHCKEA